MSKLIPADHFAIVSRILIDVLKLPDDWEFDLNDTFGNDGGLFTDDLDMANIYVALCQAYGMTNDEWLHEQFHFVSDIIDLIEKTFPTTTMKPDQNTILPRPIDSVLAHNDTTNINSLFYLPSDRKRNAGIETGSRPPLRVVKMNESFGLVGHPIPADEHRAAFADGTGLSFTASPSFPVWRKGKTWKLQSLREASEEIVEAALTLVLIAKAQKSLDLQLYNYADMRKQGRELAEKTAEEREPILAEDAHGKNLRAIHGIPCGSLALSSMNVCNFLRFVAPRMTATIGEDFTLENILIKHIGLDPSFFTHQDETPVILMGKIRSQLFCGSFNPDGSSVIDPATKQEKLPPINEIEKRLLHVQIVGLLSKFALNSSEIFSNISPDDYKANPIEKQYAQLDEMIAAKLAKWNEGGYIAPYFFSGSFKLDGEIGTSIGAGEINPILNEQLHRIHAGGDDIYEAGAKNGNFNIRTYTEAIHGALRLDAINLKKVGSKKCNHTEAEKKEFIEAGEKAKSLVEAMQKLQASGVTPDSEEAKATLVPLMEAIKHFNELRELHGHDHNDDDSSKNTAIVCIGNTDQINKYRDLNWAGSVQEFEADPFGGGSGIGRKFRSQLPKIDTVLTPAFSKEETCKRIFESERTDGGIHGSTIENLSAVRMFGLITSTKGSKVLSDATCAMLSSMGFDEMAEKISGKHNAIDLIWLQATLDQIGSSINYFGEIHAAILDELKSGYCIMPTALKHGVNALKAFAGGDKSGDDLDFIISFTRHMLKSGGASPFCLSPTFSAETLMDVCAKNGEQREAFIDFIHEEILGGDAAGFSRFDAEQELTAALRKLNSVLAMDAPLFPSGDGKDNDDLLFSSVLRELEKRSLTKDGKRKKTTTGYAEKIEKAIAALRHNADVAFAHMRPDFVFLRDEARALSKLFGCTDLNALTTAIPAELDRLKEVSGKRSKAARDAITKADNDMREALK